MRGSGGKGASPVPPSDDGQQQRQVSADGVGGWVMPEAGPDGEAKFKMTGPTGNCYDYSKARSGAYRFGLHPRSEGGEAHKRGRDADASDEAPAAKRCPKLSEDDIIAIFSQRLAELEKAEHEAARAKEVAAAAAAARAAAAAKAVAAEAAAVAAAAADAAAAAAAADVAAAAADAAAAAAAADAAATAVATAKVVAVIAATSAAKTAALQGAEALAGKEA
ncbi:unnamed protein product, partial [Ectocarpus sp. 6 AP-2014]